MQANHVSFTTSKKLDEMERMVENVGMQIILKTDSLFLKVEDLANEEKIGWLDYLENETKIKHEKFENRKKLFQDFEPRARTYTEEVYKTIKKYRDNPNLDVTGIIRALKDETSRLYLDYDRAHSYSESSRVIPYLDMFYIEDRVHGSCLIAKRGENLLRYVNIRQSKGPIITIAGAHAEIIRSQIESISELC